MANENAEKPKPDAEAKGQQAPDKVYANPPKPIVVYKGEELARTVKVQLEDCVVEVRWVAMMQCKIFSSKWEAMKGEIGSEPFPAVEVDYETFHRFVQPWLEEHLGLPDPVVVTDPKTTDRERFKFTQFEQKFFDGLEDIEDLKSVYVASNSLDIPTLYLYCAQELGDRIIGKTPEEIRQILGVEDDLTEEEKQEINADRDISVPGQDGNSSTDMSEPSAGS